jgi:hypothetical protein
MGPEGISMIAPDPSGVSMEFEREESTLVCNWTSEKLETAELKLIPAQLMEFADDYAKNRSIVSRNDVLFFAIRKYFPDQKAWTGPGRKYRDTHSWDKILITKHFNTRLDEFGNKIWRREGNQSSTRFVRINT